MGPFSLLCFHVALLLLGLEPITELEAAGEDHVVLGSRTARLSAVLANTGCRSACDLTVTVSGLHGMALCELLISPSHRQSSLSRHVSRLH